MDLVAPARVNLHRPLVFGLAVALVCLPLELSRIGFGGELGLTTLIVFWALGALVGVVIETERFAVSRLEALLGPRAWMRAGIYALGNLLCTIPLARNLFSGSFS